MVCGILLSEFRREGNLRRSINTEEIRKWTNSVGGTGRAVKLLIKETDCAPSTAEKMVRGVYPSEPQFLIRKALCELTGIDEDILFPLQDEGAQGRHHGI
jgi:hypothetical protein